MPPLQKHYSGEGKRVLIKLTGFTDITEDLNPLFRIPPPRFRVKPGMTSGGEIASQKALAMTWLTEDLRFFRQMGSQPDIPSPNWEFGFWDTTLTTWHSQGLPEAINTPVKAYRYFGLESPHFGEGYFLPAGANLRLCPPLPSRSCGIHNRREVLVDGDGVKFVQMVEGARTIPHFIDYPLKVRKEWEEIYKPRLDPKKPGRFSEIDWPLINNDFNERGYPRFLYLDSFMGYLRNLMGFEAFAMLPYDDPALFEEMVETLTQVKEGFLDRLSGKVKIDMVHFWEDICYNAGPIIHPKVFIDLVVPRIRRVIKRLREEFGCRYFCVDCDGDFRALMEGWIEAGVNIIVPCEVDAGMDIIRLQDIYGKRCSFHGGIQKKALIQGPAYIEAELERVKPAVKRGGYIPHLDHACPANVTLENYRVYLRLKREILGCL